MSLERIEDVGDRPLAIDADIEADPKNWGAMSRQLWQCADLLLANDKKTYCQAWMLYGLAIETALKGFLLAWKDGPYQGSAEQRLKDIIGECRHDLQKLYKKVMPGDIDERTQKCLQFAAECIQWRGKYPSPSAGQLKDSKFWASISVSPGPVLRDLHEFLLNNLEPKQQP